jgi:hypothetical protein
MRPPTSSLFAVLAVLAASVPARADVEDLSTGQRPGLRGRPPALFILRAQGGTDFAPGGLVGGTLSWFNDATQIELEGSVGFGNPGTQLGFSVRRLFGADNDYLVSELTLAGNASARKGANPLVPGTGRALWTNLGFGFEHRSWVSLSVTGGLTFLGFSEAPTAYLQGGLGLGF